MPYSSHYIPLFQVSPASANGSRAWVRAGRSPKRASEAPRSGNSPCSVPLPLHAGHPEAGRNIPFIPTSGEGNKSASHKNSKGDNMSSYEKLNLAIGVIGIILTIVLAVLL